MGFLTFLFWVAVIIAGSAAAAWVFREALRRTMPETIAKPMRQAPLTAAFGLLVILIYIICGLFADLIAPYGQAEVFDKTYVPPGGDPAIGGDPRFILGTDQIGRDIFSRLIYGAQNTVGIAFITTVLTFVLGATMGFLAATVGGWLDQLLSRIVDVLMSIPQLIFALLLMTVATSWAADLDAFNLLIFSVDAQTLFMIVIIAVLDSTRVYRLARAVGLNIVVMDYVEAAKLRGEGLSHLIFKEILPNAYAPLLAEFGLRFCFVFLLIAALSFLGIGIQPPLADWGSMVAEMSQFISYASFDVLQASLPLMAAGAIALLTVAVNFVVDWMLHRSSGLKE
ncbi:MAG: ABC transporter permease [Pseudomonadota bacterium]